MVKINLLPWREQARLKRWIRFGITLGVSLVFTLVILILVHIYYKHLLNSQQSRNTYLQKEIGESQIKLEELKKERDNEVALEKQLDFVIELRAKSLRAIKLIDALEETTPPGLVFEKIIRENNSINILGTAKTDLQITLFMKNLENLHNFKQPVLTEISSESDSASIERHFQLKIQQQE